MSAIDEYKGQHLTIVNEGKRCIHSRYCVLNLNSVFKPNVDGPWIDPDAADTETDIAVITKCPSGALRFKPEGDTQAEHPPTVNTVRVWENGPLAFHAELDVAGEKSSYVPRYAAAASHSTNPIATACIRNRNSKPPANRRCRNPKSLRPRMVR